MLDDPRAEALVQEAESVGLLPRIEKAGKAIDRLREIDVDAEPTLNIEGLEQELERRRSERERLLLQQRQVRHRIEMLRALTREEVGYDGELDSQRARLKSVNLMPTNGRSLCPICEQPLTDRLPTTTAISGSIQRLDSQLENITASRPKIEEAIAELEHRAIALREKLVANQSVINTVEWRTERMRAYRDEFVASAMVRGRIQYYLESATAATSGTESLIARIDGSREIVRELEQELSLENVEERMDSMLRYIEDDMTSWSKELDLEYTTHVRLDPKRLTVVADTRNGPLPLERMGSGANWLGYHIIAYAALHHWFQVNDRPVPRFIVFDQPTQVFYPKDSDDPMAYRNDDDRERVYKLFSFLAKLPHYLNNTVQVIVTDHALLELSEFTDAVRANWHLSDALIPGDWPKRATETPAD